MCNHFHLPRVDKFSYAEKLSKDKDSMRNVLLFWLSYWRDVLLCAGKSSVPIANIDRAQEIKSIAESVSMSEARARGIQSWKQTLSQLESNVNGDYWRKSFYSIGPRYNFQ